MEILVLEVRSMHGFYGKFEREFCAPAVIFLGPPEKPYFAPKNEAI